MEEHINKTTYSFWSLISQYRIEIPMIQRDYAQGRDDPKVLRIRKELVHTLKKAVEKKKAIDFDFIYGRVETIDDIKLFIPIDGQQRLTTLFLLHWYASLKGDVNTETHQLLTNFTYKTRPSSKRFCEKLVTHRPDVNNIGKLSEEIKDNSWFIDSWEKDPTVSAMLLMLDQIHEEFKSFDTLFTLLTNDKAPLITFQFSEMAELGLNDSIYIRMNSRGKPLTEFENFKARFEQFLEQHYGNELVNKFAQNVDKTWTDFLWQYKDTDNLIDGPFLKVFDYISELIFYRNSSGLHQGQLVFFDDYKKEFDYWEKLYSNQEHIDFLFSVFELFVSWKNTTKFFQDFFPDSAEDDLINRCIKDVNFQIPEKVALYMFIKNGLSDTPIEKEEFLNCLRIVKNLLSRVRQFNWPVYNSNLRYREMQKYLQAAEGILNSDKPVYNWLLSIPNIPPFSEQSVQFEKEKAQIIVQKPEIKKTIHAIENDIHFQGSIHNILQTVKPEELDSFYKAFREVWSREDHIAIIQAMLTCDFYGVWVGTSSIGERWYFGHSNNWYGLLSQNEDLSLVSFLRHYVKKRRQSIEDFLSEMKEEWLAKQNDFNDWRFYFIKYREFFSEDPLIFAFYNNGANFEIRRLKTKTARGFHVNPYAYTAAKIVADGSLCEPGDCFTSGHDYSPLTMKNGITLECKEEGWICHIPETLKLKQKTKKLMEMSTEGMLCLKETPGKDRIEIAVDFINTFK